eukprot:11221289-Lingulodinium_polyedra.AAC.1
MSCVELVQSPRATAVFAVDSEASDMDCGAPAESDSPAQAPDTMDSSQPMAYGGMMPGEFAGRPTDVVLISLILL